MTGHVFRKRRSSIQRGRKLVFRSIGTDERQVNATNRARARLLRLDKVREHSLQVNGLFAGPL